MPNTRKATAAMRIVEENPVTESTPETTNSVPPMDAPYSNANLNPSPALSNLSVSPTTPVHIVPLTFDPLTHSLPENSCNFEASETPKLGMTPGATVDASHKFSLTEAARLEDEISRAEAEVKLKREQLLRLNSGGPTGRPTRGVEDLGLMPGPSGQTDDIAGLLRSVLLSSSLPKLEIRPFCGLPGELVPFLTSFKTAVECKVSDPGQRLSYLLHYCSGTAREAIKHCVLLPVDKGYESALKILQTEFGKPYQVMQAVTADLFDGPPIRANDLESLRTLVRQMRTCSMTLRQLGREANLNNTINLLRLVRRLPKPFQVKWAEAAEALMALDREPTFDDLLSMVEKRVRISETEFGMLAFESSKPSSAATTPFRRVAAASHIVPAIVCPLCKVEHELERCTAFLKLNTEQRWRVLKENKRCFRCLKSNHRIRDCKSRLVCQADGCSKYHHSLLHVPQASPLDAEGRTCTSYSLQSTGVLLGFIPVRIQGPHGSVLTNAFIDNGSDCTLIDDSISTQLGLERRPTSLRITTLHGMKAVRCSETKATLSSLDGSFTLDLEPIISIDRLPVHETDRAVTDLSRWPHLNDIYVDFLSSRRVGLLIGCDFPELHKTVDQRVGNKSEPFAMKTVLGWVLRGPLGPREPSTLRVNALSTVSPESLLTRLYNNEFQDMENPEELQPSLDDDKANDMVQASAKVVDGHYELAVPWRENGEALPDNYHMALARLFGLERKFGRDANLRERYANSMAQHIEKGHIRCGKASQKRWYLPHHPVVNPKKPEKLRVVFDCAASFRGVSLNSMLLQGPDIMNSLTGVLHRFRRYRVACCADIKEMFLQVRLPEKDKWAFSLLWRPDGNPKEDPVVYEWNVHPFGATSSPFCANYALRRTFMDNIARFEPELDMSLLRQFYVDDLLYSSSSIEKARSTVSALTEMLKLGGFDLVKWNSNIPDVLNPLNPGSCLHPVRELAAGGGPQRTLGVKWEIAKDVFTLDMVEPVRRPTRRSLLAFVASIFDPLGFAAPLLLPGKLILQETCRRGVGWDSEIDDGELKAYHKWVRSLATISTVQIARCLIHDPDNCTFQLHVFSDAAENGYGAVAYLRGESRNGSVYCRFLMGKSRVAPLKFTTIPRLELTAALVAAKLGAHIMRELDVKFDRVFYWTDSTIVLSYLARNSARFVTFVANRVRRILELTVAEEWRHVPSKLNPADLASRGVSDDSKRKMDLWLDGPEFLKNVESSWPKDFGCMTVPDDALEIKRVGAIVTSNEWFTQLVDRCRDWLTLLRRVAWLSRFKIFLLIKTKAQLGQRINIGVITAAEIAKATDDVIRLCQREAFSRQGKLDRVPALRSLKPTIVNGIVCLGGRVSHCESKRLPILPARSRTTDLIVQHYHRLEGHSGASHLLATLRSRYWLIKGMATVRHNLKRCIECKLMWAQPCQQVMAPLPPCRVDVGTRPFYHCGVDYFGPFFVSCGRKQWKRFGCLFTCMQTRAVHIEVAHGMSSDSFLMALIRFISRRGAPKFMYSDNGSNFVGADKELQTMLRGFDQDLLAHRLLVYEITWKFNPPYASHRGGAWERIIRSIRRVLSGVMKEQVVSDEVLLTSLSEVERILNDRPLVPVYDDPEQPDVLRPSDLLQLRSESAFVVEDVPLRERLTRRWRQAQHLANVFWKRWKREYLPTLEATRKWLHPHRNLRKGDLVILSRVETPRGQWPKGLITECLKGPDGQVRQVMVRTGSGIVRRDIRSLCLLEGVEERDPPASS